MTIVMHASAKTFTYRDWVIGPSLASYHRSHDWTATHKDYDPSPQYYDDGPSDHRHFTGSSAEDLQRQIDDWYLEQEDNDG